MFEPILESVIGIDTDNEIIRLYSMKNGDKNSISYYVGNYKADGIGEEFYNKLGIILKKYHEDLPTIPLNKVSLILPDSLILTDTVTVPTLAKRTMESSVDVTLTNLYKNCVNIKFNRFIVAQNKENTTYSVVGIRRKILADIHKVFEKNQVGISNITFASNAAVDGAFILNPKLKNSSFVLLDIKETEAKIIFVVKGRTLGFYSLPFGRNALYKTRVAAEDLLFDHSAAELVVLNANELAKAKALTSYDATVSEPVDDDEEPVLGSNDAPLIVEQRGEAEGIADEEDEEEALALPGGGLATGSQASKKSPRRLPKFMIRETPVGRNGFIYENFRIFIKWTLDSIAANQTITSFDAPEAVYVNLPKEYDFLYEKINENEADHKLKFLPITTSQVQENIRDNLELFGGFYAKQVNKINNLHYSQFDTIKKVKKTDDKSKKPEGNPITQKLLAVIESFNSKKGAEGVDLDEE